MLGLFENPFRRIDEKREQSRSMLPKSRALAREAGRKSIVLLKNDGDLLPLPKSGKKIALIGPFGTSPDHPLNRLALRAWAGPGRPVDRALCEGDEVAGFAVLEVPGHSAGHVAYWRESDRVLILGDVLNNMNVMTGIPGLNEPPAFFTTDPAENRRSARRLAALEPRLMLFGHGAPLRDTGKLVEFVGRLAA